MKHFDAIMKDICPIIYPPQVQNSPKERCLTCIHHIPNHTTCFVFLYSKEKRKQAGFALGKLKKRTGLGRKQKRSHCKGFH